MLVVKIIYPSCVFYYTEVPESCLEVVQYNKLQRPTSLPIQPFVLQPPSGKQTSNVLGSLIDHYMSHKHGSSKSSDLPSHLASSPLDNYSFAHLEAASCTDTCSTCTPTPCEPHMSFQSDPDHKYRITATEEPSLPDKSPEANHTCLDQTYPSLNLSETGQEKNLLQTFSNKHVQSFHAEQFGSHRTSQKFIAPETRPQNELVYPYYSSSPAITSVTSLTSVTSFVIPGAGQSSSDAVLKAHTTQDLNTTAIAFGPKKPHCKI